MTCLRGRDPHLRVGRAHREMTVRARQVVPGLPVQAHPIRTGSRETPITLTTAPPETMRGGGLVT